MLNYYNWYKNSIIKNRNKTFLWNERKFWKTTVKNWTDR